MSVQTEKDGFGRVLVTPERRTRHTDEGARRVIMLASPVRRPNDAIDLTLLRLRDHNALVTSVVLEHANDGAGDEITYLHNGVLVSFPANHLDCALLTAVQIMRRLRRHVDAEAGTSLETRIGIASGDVIAEQHADGAPQDRTGRPIEIAVRLVSDIAKPGQIVLSAGTVTADQLRAIDSLQQLELWPDPASKLQIDGVTNGIGVMQLTWDGARPGVDNWRQLQRELTDLNFFALRLQYALNEKFENLGAKGVEPTTFPGLVEMINPADATDEAEEFDQMWQACHGARAIEALETLKERLDTARARLVQTWEAKEAVIRTGGDPGRDAGRDCVEEFEVIMTALRRFSRSVDRQINAIQELL